MGAEGELLEQALRLYQGRASGTAPGSWRRPSSRRWPGNTAWCCCKSRQVPCSKISETAKSTPCFWGALFVLCLDGLTKIRYHRRRQEHKNTRCSAKPGRGVFPCVGFFHEGRRGRTAMTLTKIRKRDGRLAEFNEEKIARAIEKAFNATYKPGRGRRPESWPRGALHPGGGGAGPARCGAHSGSGGAGAHGQRLCADRQVLHPLPGGAQPRPGDEHPADEDYEDITFSKAKDSDIKRENANIDGDTAMGTMLKYGSESAKQFYEMYVLNPKHAKAHRGRYPHP